MIYSFLTISVNTNNPLTSSYQAGQKKRPLSQSLTVGGPRLLIYLHLLLPLQLYFFISLARCCFIDEEKVKYVGSNFSFNSYLTNHCEK